MSPPVIDIHEHILPRRGFLRPGRGDTFITAAEMVALMDRVGIGRAVVLPIVSPESPHVVQTVEEAFEACDQFPGRFIKFCNVDPRQGCNLRMDFVPVLEYYKSLGAKGLGEITANLWWHDPRVRNLFRACEAVDLPVIFHMATRNYNTYGLISERGLVNLEEALQAWPRLQFLGHSQGFWAEVGPEPTLTERESYPSGPVKPGGRLPELLRRYPNLWGDLSAGSGLNAVRRDPEWGYAFLEEFQDRLLMGLDVCWPWNDKCELLTFLREGRAKGRISAEAFDKIMGGNATRLLRLE